MRIRLRRLFVGPREGDDIDGNGRWTKGTNAVATIGSAGRVAPHPSGFSMTGTQMSAVTDSAAEEHLAYSGSTLTFASAEARAEFDSFMLQRRLLLLRTMAMMALLLGCIIAIAIVQASQAGRIAVTALLLAGGTAGAVVGFFALPGTRITINVAAAAMYVWLMGLVTATLFLLELDGDEPGDEPYDLAVPFLLLVLHLLALLGPASHAPVVVVAAMEIALAAALLKANLEAVDSSDEVGPTAAAVLSTLLVASMLACWSAAVMRRNLVAFAQSKQLRRVHDAQAHIRIREEAERQKRDYVAQTLHDVGTPLATFALAIESMKTAGPVDAEHLEIIRTCECAIELMTLTRRKAIDYAKHSTGKELRPRLGSTDVRDLVETKCRRIMSGFNSASTVPIRFNVDSHVAKYVVTDGDFLWECLVNLLSNAVKFTNDGEINCNVYLVTPERLRFEVRDTGIGIPHERKQQLFQPFAQLQKFAAGTGLGLWSVKQKILALQGDVNVHDNPGGGSVFFFDVPYKPDFVLESALEYMKETRASNDSIQGALSGLAGSWTPGTASVLGGAGLLPAAAAAGGGGASSSSAEAKYDGTAQGGAVLLVDSRQSTHEVAQALLENHGFTVERAINGFDGLARMQKKMYAAVLVDYHVMVLDALQLLQKFRDWEESVSAKRTEKQFVCVMFSGAPPEVELNAAINSGADAVWTDPLIPDSKDIVMMLEDERQARREEKGKAAALRSSPRRRASNASNASNASSGGASDLDNAAAAAAGSGGGGSNLGRRPAAAVAGAGAAAVPSERKVLGRVLLIEDEQSILRLEQKMFERHGFEVDTATNGEEGLTRMKEREFDAVFTDIMMPIMDGYETVRRFRRWEEENAASRTHRQLVYAVSANASEQDHNMARMVGMDGFASKPVKVKELVEIVKQRRRPSAGS